MSRFQWLVAVIISLVLSACGGGGGGGGGVGDSTSITVSSNSLTFNAVENSSAVDSKSVKVTFKGDGMIIGYPTGVFPASWLNVDSDTYTQSPVTAQFYASALGLSKGTYKTTIRFVTGKQDGTQIKYVDVPVTLVVKGDPSLKITTAAYSEQFIFGASNTSSLIPVDISGEAQWDATSNQSWLKLSSASGSGATTLNTSIDASGLLPGDYSATLTVVDKMNSANRSTLNYNIHISLPVITASQSSILIGGSDVSTIESQNLFFSINTGANSYPFKLIITTDNGSDWLKASVTEGTLSSTGGDIQLSANHGGLNSGTYTGKIKIEVTVGDSILSKEISVTFKKPEIKITSSAYAGEFIYGSDVTQENVPISLQSAGIDWTVTADKPWLKVRDTHGNGASIINTIVDSSSLEPGDYLSVLTVVDKLNVKNKATLNYFLHVKAPTLSLEQSSIVLGGDDGISDFVKSLRFSLNTGTTNYPYTLVVTTNDGALWLHAGKSVGVISSSPQDVSLSADRSLVVGGTYYGTVKVETIVGAVKLSKEVAITFNKEAHRIFAGLTGVSFSSIQNKGVLTRKVKIFSSLARNDIPWSATSDQAWLNVTSLGRTGDYITLNASANSLPEGEYYANVTIKSSDKEVDNQETIRVGFIIANIPTADFSISTSATETFGGSRPYHPFIVASPVEPLIYTNVDKSIKAYNVYSGIEVRSFDNVVAQSGSMAISGDGKLLFVFDQINGVVVELDAKTGSIIKKYLVPVSNQYSYFGDVPIAYLRPNGFPVLVGAGSKIYDLNTNKSIENVIGSIPAALSLSTSDDPSLVVTDFGALFSLKYSALASKKLASNLDFSAHSSYGAEGEACISADGARIYTASGSPYDFYGTGIRSQVVEQVLPGSAYPNSIKCLWNGLIVGGASAYYDTDDIFIYEAKTGNNLGKKSSSTNFNYRYLVHKGLAVSADATRLIALSENNSQPNQIRFMSLPSISQ